MDNVLHFGFLFLPKASKCGQIGLALARIEPMTSGFRVKCYSATEALFLKIRQSAKKHLRLFFLFGLAIAKMHKMYFCTFAVSVCRAKIRNDLAWVVLESFEAFSS